MLKSFAEAGIENAFESEFEKTGKDLIKNIHQIEYGSEELSKIAIKYRKDNGITSAGRNICVVEYIEKNGENTTKTFVSNATKHSEELMIEYLKSNPTAKLHICTLLSDGGVSSHIEHLKMFLKAIEPTFKYNYTKNE